jgi:hypothetical protein
VEEEELEEVRECEGGERGEVVRVAAEDFEVEVVMGKEKIEVVAGG